MSLNVYCCPCECNFLSNSIALLCVHIRERHADSHNFIVCAQEGCRIGTTFSSLRSFKKHLQKFHKDPDTVSNIPTFASALHSEETASLTSTDETIHERDIQNALQSIISEFVLKLRCKSGINECLTMTVVAALKEVIANLQLAICTNVKLFCEISTLVDAINEIFNKVSVLLKQFEQFQN